MENSARVPRKTSTVLKAMGGGGGRSSRLSLSFVHVCCTLYEVIWSIKTIHGIIFESIFAFLLVSKCFAQLSVCEICFHPFIQWMRKEFRRWSSKRRNIKKEAMSLLLRIIQGPHSRYFYFTFFLLRRGQKKSLKWKKTKTNTGKKTVETVAQWFPTLRSELLQRVHGWIREVRVGRCSLE